MGMVFSTYIFQLSFATTATTIVSGPWRSGATSWPTASSPSSTPSSSPCPQGQLSSRHSDVVWYISVPAMTIGLGVDQERLPQCTQCGGHCRLLSRASGGRGLLPWWRPSCQAPAGALRQRRQLKPIFGLPYERPGGNVHAMVSRIQIVHRAF
ncbi:hypothetical protein CEXT_478451 [Caerostris extrusa]|uniref:Secreted protein n=1 Tax=Caerostris extrusa TaxID=172846 RepID=A0AAV4NY02_CAEEX|nr:hypothetical protein CEXT_478451 [Caerostris extrusa]